MELFQKILKAAVDSHASDIHIKLNTPIIFRINRQLIAIEAPFPTAEWVDNVIEHIVPKHAKKRLIKENKKGDRPCRNRCGAGMA